jgi:ankyrin repeat protein
MVTWFSCCFIVVPELSMGDKDRCVALLVASDLNRIDLVCLLLNRGANVEHVNEEWITTALLVATKFNHIDVVHLLLNKRLLRTLSMMLGKKILMV